MSKVVYIVSSLNVGGAETLVINLCKNIKDYDIEVLVVKSKKNTRYEKELNDSNIHVSYGGCKRKRFLSNNYKIYKLLKKIKPDIIHINDSILATVLIPIILTGKSKQSIYTIHTDPKKDGLGYRKLFNTFALKVLKFKFIAINELNQIRAEKFYKDKTIELVNNGIPIVKNEERTFDVMSKRRIDLIHVGRFVDVKNHDFLISVFNNINTEFEKAYLNLIGDGPLKEAMEKKVKELKLEDKVIFHGETNKVYEKLKESDIFVFPSKYEGSPLAVIEAMNLGLPIVASNKGGIPGIVKDGVNGYISDLNESIFIENIKKIMNDKKTYEMISTNNVEKSKQYDIKITADKYCNIYKNICE